MSNFLKKFRIISLSFLLLFILVGCDSNPVDEDPDPDPIVDTTAPVFSGVENVHYVIGDSVPDYLDGITVEDDTDGDITTSIIIDSSLVDLATVGTYTITITVSDDAGNEETSMFDVIVTILELTDLEKATLDITNIDLDTKFELKTRFINGTRAVWTSDNVKIITNGGYINRPAIGEDDVSVVLTALFTNGTYTETVTYTILVKAREESVVSSFVELDFEGTSDEYIVENKEDIKIFFVDEGTVPYIDVQTFIEMLDGAIDSSLFTYTFQNGDELIVSYEVDIEDIDGEITTETFTAIIDFTENTFYIDTFTFFDYYVSETESDYGEGLNYVGVDYVDGTSVTIPLGDYKFDLVIYNDGSNDLFLLPFHVANLLFAGNIYYDAYYNGDMIYGLDTFGISSGGEEADALHELARTSTFNELNMELDMKEASFNFLALSLDYFYGLKMDQEVDSYYEFLYGYVDEFMLQTDTKLYTKIFEMANALNDLHTSHVFAGYYTDADYAETYLELTSISQLGPRARDFYTGLWAIQARYEEKYGSISKIPGYEVIDDGRTAVIHITGFTIDSPDEFRTVMELLPETVVNVVIDLAYNTGGNVGAVLRIFGYMTEEAFQYHAQNPADGSAVTYYIESDYIAYDYNWYIVSSEVTFSAANLMVSMAKELGIATIIGHTSSGGASSIGVISTPDGSVLLISTNNIISTRVGNEIDGYEYLSIEFGVEPDIYIGNVVSDEEIIAAILLDQEN